MYSLNAEAKSLAKIHYLLDLFWSCGMKQHEPDTE